MKLLENLNVIYLLSQKQLVHPLAKQIDKISKRYSLYFSMLSEVIEDNPDKVYENATTNVKAFLSLVKERCEKNILE